MVYMGCVNGFYIALSTIVDIPFMSLYVCVWKNFQANCIQPGPLKRTLPMGNQAIVVLWPI